MLQSNHFYHVFTLFIRQIILHLLSLCTSFVILFTIVKVKNDLLQMYQPFWGGVAFRLGHIGPRKVLRSFFPSYNVMISTHAVSRVFMIYKTGLRYLQAEQRVLLAAVTCTSNMCTNSQTLEIQGRLRSKLKDLCIYLQVVRSLSQGLTTWFTLS